MTWCTVRWLCVQGLWPLAGKVCQKTHTSWMLSQMCRTLVSHQATGSCSDLENLKEAEDTRTGSQRVEDGQGEGQADPIRKVGRTKDFQKGILMLEPDSPPNAKVLRVAVIGRPNCGKSTLTNSLMGWRVCSVSDKVHTTKKNTLAVYTEGDTQIIFLDTPGILSPGSRKKHNLEDSLEIDPIRSMANADIVVAMCDVSIPQAVRELDKQLMQHLYLYRHIPAILVLNKVDLIKNRMALLQTVRIMTDGVVGRKSLIAKPRLQRSKKEHMFDKVDRSLGLDNGKVEEESELEEASIPAELRAPVDEAVRSGQLGWVEYFEKVRDAARVANKHRGWPLFDQVFAISSLRGEGVYDLKSYLMDQACSAPWPYHSSLVTDQRPDEVVLLSVRQALLDNLRNEVPYRLGLDLDLFEIDSEDDLLNVIVNIRCESERQLTIFLGRNGGIIRKVSGQSKQAIMDTFRCDVRLKLVATLKPRGKR